MSYYYEIFDYKKIEMHSLKHKKLICRNYLFDLFDGELNLVNKISRSLDFLYASSSCIADLMNMYLSRLGEIVATFLINCSSPLVSSLFLLLFMKLSIQYLS